MIDVVYAVGTDFVHLPNGGRVKVQKGTHWPSDDPAVRTRPELFSADPRWGMWYSREPEGYGDPVEEATAVPGEKRSVRRGS